MILTKGLGHERHKLLLIKTFDESDLFDHVQQTKHLVKKAKGP
jgi:hypothetical protein